MTYGAPTISGAHSGVTTSYQHAVAPFYGVTVVDPNQPLSSALMDSVTITLSADTGDLWFDSLDSSASATASFSGAGVSYTLTDYASRISGDLSALWFTPKAGTVNVSVTTGFSLTVASMLNSAVLATSATDSTTTVVDANPLTTPLIGVNAPNQVSYWDAPVSAFADVVLVDFNPGVTERLTIAMTGGGGSLADGAGFTGLSTLSGGDGLYTLTGTDQDVTSELEQLVFTPTAGVSGAQTTTSFTLTDEVMLNGQSLISASDSTLNVIDKDTPVAPTIALGGYPADTFYQRGVNLFQIAPTVTDLNPGTTERVTIALSGAGGTLADGISTTGGLDTLAFADGVYTLTGTAAQVEEELGRLVFTPDFGVFDVTGVTTVALTDDAMLNGAVFAAGAAVTTTVNDYNAAQTPLITQPSARTATAYQAPVTPFAEATLSDDDPFAVDKLTIALSGGDGTLADGAGFSGLSFANGLYALTGTAAQVQAELNALLFTPAANPAGSVTTTSFRLTDYAMVDGAVAATSATDSSTQVIDMAPATAVLAISAVWTDTLAGTSSSTTSATATLAGVNDPATAGQTIALYDGATEIGTATATAQGAWTATVTLSDPASASLTAVEGASASAAFAVQPLTVTGAWLGATDDKIVSILGVDAAGDVIGTYKTGPLSMVYGFVLSAAGEFTAIRGVNGDDFVSILGYDQAGDVLIRDISSASTSYQLFSAQGGYTTASTQGLTPVGMDGAGDIFAINAAGTNLVELPAGGGPIALPDLGLYTADLYDVNVDQAGDVYATRDGVALLTGASAAVNISIAGAANYAVSGVSNGAVFGTFDNTVTGFAGAFVERDGTVETIIPPGAVSTTVAGVTATGEVFGAFRYNYYGAEYGFTEQNGVYAIVSAPDAASTELLGVTASGALYGQYTDQNGLAHGFIAQNGVYQTIDIGGLSASTMLIGVDDKGVAYGDFTGTTSIGAFTAQNGIYATDAPVAGSPLTLLWGVDGAGDTFGANYFGGDVVSGFTDIGGVVTAVDIPASLGTAEITVVAGEDNGAVYGFYFDDQIHISSFIEQNGAFKAIAVAGASDTWVIGGRLGKAFGLSIGADGLDHGFVYDIASGTYATVDDPKASQGGAVSSPSIPLGGSFSLSLGAGSGVSGMDAQGNLYGTYVDDAGHAHGFEDSNGVFSDIDVTVAGLTVTDTVITRVSDNGAIVGSLFTPTNVYGFSELGGVVTTYLMQTSSSPGFVNVGTGGDMIYGYASDYIAKVNVSCFCAGSRIATARGPVAVEDLRVGDLLQTLDGGLAPLRWLGRSTVATRFADPLRSMPIRIRASALGENMPTRDLRLSPDHALLIDGLLIHAGALINGASIVRETAAPETFVYYHVELDAHALILAEGAPAETFVDNADRMSFDNWAEHQALYPDGKAMAELPYPRVKARRQAPMRILRALDRRASEIGATAAA